MQSIPSGSDSRGLAPETVERIHRPTVEAGALPNEAYKSEAFLALERDRLFAPTWTCIGHACTIPHPATPARSNSWASPCSWCAMAKARFASSTTCVATGVIRRGRLTP